MGRLLMTGVAAFAAQAASAASGEMGNGVPNFGMYSQATGSELRVWSLTNPTVNFPVGCTAIVLRPETMGADNYRMAFALLTAARLSGTRVRFYAHGDRDGGCGVDYVQLDD